MKRLFFTVTNDLTYDQRMIRICTSLVECGFDVTLVGRSLKNSFPLSISPFKQKRLHCITKKGKWFYIEFNMRLFFFLLRNKMDAVCAIDLDTILPCYFISRLKAIPRIYDAHELFCEMKEVVTRPSIYKLWKRIEQFAVPKFRWGYTVNQPIAGEFFRMYKVNYDVIRNIPLLHPINIPAKIEKYILYQGAVNEGRSFETLIPAMKDVNAPLVICGDGNFMHRAQCIVKENGLEQKIIFKGNIPPDQLKTITLNAWIGVTLFENNGLSNYYSLSNRFFDYLHAGIPQVCIDYPVYKELNNQYEIAVLTPDCTEDNIAKAFHLLMEDEVLYKRIQQNCLRAREELTWQREEQKLRAFYINLFENSG